MMKTNLPIFLQNCVYEAVWVSVLPQAGLLFLGSCNPFARGEDFCARLTFSPGIYLFTYLLDIELKALYMTGK